MIKDKVSDSVYEIYVESYPEKITREVYRGDYLTHTLIGFNNDDSPFDFSIYNEINASLRLYTPLTTGSPTHDFSDSEIVLGKKNSTSSIKDELHLTSGSALDIPVSRNRVDGWIDIEGVLNGETKSFIQIKLQINIDITRP
jgi:hypothetical protein